MFELQNLRYYSKNLIKQAVIPVHQTQNFIAAKDVTWKFNLAAAPWWGGLSEDV